MRLIGEKGIDAVTMKEVGMLAGGPSITTSPTKSAILAMLYERFSEVSRARLTAIIADVREAKDVIAAADRLLDDYHSRVAGDPAIQDLQNAIQADKALKNSTSRKPGIKPRCSATMSSPCWSPRSTSSSNAWFC